MHHEGETKMDGHVKVDGRTFPFKALMKNLSLVYL